AGWLAGERIGVQAEIRLAHDLVKPVRYLVPEEAHVSPTFAHVALSKPRLANACQRDMARRVAFWRTRRRLREEDGRRRSSRGSCHGCEIPPGVTFAGSSSLTNSW